MPDLLVRRLRVSYIAAMAHDRLNTVGDQEEFALLLLEPGRLEGIGEVSAPFPPDQPAGGDANWLFWSHIAENPRLAPPRTIGEARKLTRSGVPLRSSAELFLAEPQPAEPENARMASIRQGLARTTLEIHVLPFGLAALATLDLVEPEPTPLDQTMDDLDAISSWRFRITVGFQGGYTSMSDIATQALTWAAEALGDPRGQSWDMPAHRVVTVIDAESLDEEIPPRDGRYHRAVHRLAHGGPNLAEPLLAFVPRWTNAGFSWSTAEWVYMLDQGSSVLTRAAVQRGSLADSTSFRHRGLCLLIAHVSTSGALVRGAAASTSPFFASWGKIAAQRLGRLYGPNTPGAEFWGLETRQLIKVTGLAGPIAACAGRPLTEMFPWPTAYP